MRRLLVSVVLAVVAAAGVPEASAAVQKVEPYIGGTPQGGGVSCRGTLPAVGGACFTVPRGTRTVTVRVADQSFPGVGGKITFTDGYIDQGPPRTFCGSTRVAVPAHTLIIVVGLFDPGPPVCSAPATRGTITATFA